METNIYIKCLEKGYNIDYKGLSYNDMIQYLKDIGVPNTNTNEFNMYFYVWFFDNFYCPPIYFDRKTGKDNSHAHHYDKSNPQLDIKCPITFEARQKYLDYLSLIESNRKATFANRLSWFAIFITFFLSAIQIYFAFKQDVFNEKQNNNINEKHFKYFHKR